MLVSSWCKASAGTPRHLKGPGRKRGARSTSSKQGPGSLLRSLVTGPNDCFFLRPGGPTVAASVVCDRLPVIVPLACRGSLRWLEEYEVASSQSQLNARGGWLRNTVKTTIGNVEAVAGRGIARNNSCAAQTTVLSRLNGTGRGRGMILVGLASEE